VEFTDAVRNVLNRKGSEVFSVSPDASVFDAVARLAEEDIGALAVMEGARLVGVFSERDYARKVILLGRSSKDTRVSEAMTQPATCVPPDATIDDCMRIMVTDRTRHLMVVQHDRLMGIVSIGDLVNWMISTQAETIDRLHSYIAGSYPG
jgi:CBS domain-containing protein